MKILFLSHYFPPEVNAPASRTYEHCKQWVKMGHDVTVVTCAPNHPRGEGLSGVQKQAVPARGTGRHQGRAPVDLRDRERRVRQANAELHFVHGLSDRRRAFSSHGGRRSLNVAAVLQRTRWLFCQSPEACRAGYWKFEICGRNPFWSSVPSRTSGSFVCSNTWRCLPTARRMRSFP